MTTDIRTALDLLSAHPDFRVLTRFTPVTRYRRADEAAGPLRNGVVVDTETTGRDTDKDRVIELGIVRFSYDDAGHVYEVTDSYASLEDPGMPISPEASRVNRITDEMVRGQRIDDDRVHALLEGADIVIAHNAAFDRPFLERRLPAFAAKAWACSSTQINWDAEEIRSAKLDYIAYRLGFFYDAHRAEADCRALLHALAQPLPVSGSTGLAVLLSRHRAESFRIWAMDSRYEAKDMLAARGYRWADGKRPGDEKAWNTTVDGQQLEAELAWLKQHVYGGKSAMVKIDKVDAFSRFTNRPDRRVRHYI
jgi:DNA polymerase-3 subunit epsilon